MFWASVFFVGWFALMALRGYVRGFWVALFDLVGLLAAYTACILFGQKLVSLLQNSGIAFYLAYLAGFALLFITVNWLVSLAPRVIFAKTLRQKKLLTWPGAALGGFSGLLSGLVMLWCFQFANGMLFNPERYTGSLAEQSTIDRTKHQPHFLVGAANKLMSVAAKVGAKLRGANSQQSALVAAMVTAPDSLRSIAQSRELQQFYSDSQVQYLMATNNHQALLAHARFRALMEQQGVLRLRQSLVQNRAAKLELSSGLEQSPDIVLDTYLAKQLSYLWKRMTLIKNDAELQSLLHDKDVQQLIEARDIAGLLSYRKMQQIVAKLLHNDPAVTGVDFTQFVDVNYNSTE